MCATPSLEDRMNTLLAEYRSPDGMIDYERLRDNPEDVEKIVSLIEEVDVASMTKEEEKAFLLNTYNFLVINSIIQDDLVNSVKEDEQFFEKSRIAFNGDSSSLDDIEHSKIREAFNDPRIHFALNCGAKSCPPLNPEIFNGDELENQLDNATRSAMNDTSYVSLNEKERTIELSPIFDWYQEDFEVFGGPVQFINQYRDDPIPNDYAIRYKAYNWDLNSN